jgi:hypothetical protein
MSDMTTMRRRDGEIRRRGGDGLCSLDLVGALEVCDVKATLRRAGEVMEKRGVLGSERRREREREIIDVRIGN